MRTRRVGQASPLAADVDAGQAMRLLVLADGSKLAVEGVIARGSAPDASAADRAAAAEVARCVGALTRAAGPLETLALELRESLSSGRQARVSVGQAAALETFAKCAASASGAADGAKKRCGVLNVLLGLGLPAAAVAAAASL